VRSSTRRFKFRSIAANDSNFPVTIVTPEDGYFIHNFFDVRPWSPSERLLACLKLPFQDRTPGPEDEAVVCVIDLEKSEILNIAPTKGWGLQVGAHICWGPTDELLYFNDKDGSDVFAVEYNLKTGISRRLSGPVYQIATDGSALYGPSLALINHSQNGYGATIDPGFNCAPALGASDAEGLWRTDVKHNARGLLFSLRQAYELLPDKHSFEGGRFIFFHTKLNRQNNRIMQVVRCIFDDGRPENRFIVTMDMDGNDARIALPFELWLPQSHHPEWHPDGEHILMNLNLNVMRFSLFNYDGTDLRILCPSIRGGGHPSFSLDGRYILTDAYTSETWFVRDNKVPIRLVDVRNESESAICYVPTFVQAEHKDSIWKNGNPNELRCDPHPVWNQRCTKVCFNAAPGARRQVLVADVADLPIQR